MKTIFTITLMSECPSYEVTGDMSSTLETVWNSQKHWFMPGVKVLISDDSGHSKVFEKKQEIASR